MTTFLATFALLAILMAIMAVGVVFGDRRLRGSCGGVPGKECSCSMTERRACERKSAGEGIVAKDDHRHLDVVDDEVR
ncbi:MAG: hypothetical protein OXU20_39240 [Myxococcales bacterium]|nr:hypothetical protein [Myxococcales bacterium]MDD9966534.1 hypothetical protein [Myxococcales bacterium]